MTSVVEAPVWWDGDPQEWRGSVSAWVDAVLGASGRHRTGALEPVKRQPWSIVLRVPTDHGPVWFKENAPAQRPEAALLATVSAAVPGAVPEPLAVDRARGWMLLPDHGTTVRDLGRDSDVGLWVDVVGRWSAVTRTLAAHTTALASDGAAWLRPRDALAYLRRRTEECASLPADDPAALGPDDADALRAATPALADALAALDALGMPDTLVHNDLHTHNVFVPATPAAPYVVFDLGDALLSHPLVDLLIPLRFAAYARDTSVADPALDPIVEAALRVWSDAVDVTAMRAALPGALVLGALARSESWRRIVTPAAAAADPDLATASPGWLVETLEVPGVTQATPPA